MKFKEGGNYLIILQFSSTTRKCSVTCILSEDIVARVQSRELRDFQEVDPQEVSSSMQSLDNLVFVDLQILQLAN